MTKRSKKAYLPQPKRRTAANQSVPLVLQGRERDIALIEHLIERIDQGGSTLVISGEPGIGKSALLEVASYRAREHGVTVLTMTGVLAEVHLPFAALEQALRPLMKRAATLVLASDPPCWRPSASATTQGRRISFWWHSRR